MYSRADCRAAALAVLLAVPSLVAADDPTARGFDPDPHRYALGLDADFMVETARVLPRGSWRGELLFDYIHGALAARLGDTKIADLLDARLSIHALASYSFGPVEVGVDLPVVAKQWPTLTALTSRGYTGPLVAPIGETALGDVRMAGKVALINENRAPLGLAAMLDVRLPTGDKQAFTSDGLAVVPSVVATRHFGSVRVNAQVGYLFRKDPGQYIQLVATDGLTFGLSGSVPLGEAKNWRAIGELTGQWPRGDLGTDRHRMPLSARVGLRARVWQKLSAEFGGGKGLGEAGYGREGYRFFAGVRWDDTKPEEGERPSQPADRDGDGIPDDEDRCPDVPGLKEFQGCPDRDKDGVPDPQDRCPDVPGPKELEGCPDRDKDEIPDIDDKCPDEPGPALNDGCPGETRVEIETERISLKDAINFDFGKAIIKSESFPILDKVVAALQSHPELKRIRIEGHTDNVGTAAYNRDLSQRRAAAVVRYLTEKGVARGRLFPQGFGFDKPVASNATALGRAKNRRVEFMIVEEKSDATGANKGQTSQ